MNIEEWSYQRSIQRSYYTGEMIENLKRNI